MPAAVSTCSSRRGLTDVYGELTDVDNVDWMKIANVDVRTSCTDRQLWFSGEACL